VLRSIPRITLLSESAEKVVGQVRLEAGMAKGSTRFPARLCSLLCLAATAAVCAGCAGYRVGTRSLHYPQIRTVHVPVFESTSFRRNLGERLTEAVVRHIELKTNYKVVNDPLADSVLRGKIVSEIKRVAAVTRYSEPRDTETRLAVQLSWTDQHGNALGQPRTVPVPLVLADVSQAADAVTEAGQSIAVTHEKAIDRLAEQIVSQLEVPW
jgi:hypothetical protein